MLLAVEDIFCGNSERVRGLTISCGNGKSEGVGGLQLKFPPCWGSGYFLETHIIVKAAGWFLHIYASFWSI